jgi:metal-sulfur cluster biosynthetic enzyme
MGYPNPPTFLKDAILKALANVLDPELDRPITELGFVRDVRIGDSIEVEIVTSTYWCSPNFIYMILEDARREVSEHVRVPLDKVRVYIRGHFDESRINECISKGISFNECYKEEAWGDLGDLKKVFMDKSLRSRLYQLTVVLLRYGLNYEDIVNLRSADVIDEGYRIVIRGGDRILEISNGVDINIVRGYINTLKRLVGDTEYLAVWSTNGDRPRVSDIRDLVEGKGRLLRLSFNLNSELCSLLLESRLSRTAL